MITPKQIAEKTMTKEKREQAHNDYIAFYIGRKLSYIFTIPFLYTNIRPDTISKLSLIPTLLGFIACCLAKSKVGMLIACALFFIQDMLDGIDGNVARYKGIYSKYGSVWDALSGYFMGCVSFLGTGIATAHLISDQILQLNFDPELYITFGAITGMAIIFPRLVMHKAITTVGEEKDIDGIKDKGKFDIIKILALNLSSSAGGVQILRIVAVCFNLLNWFTILYFVFFSSMAIVSIIMMLRDRA